MCVGVVTYEQAHIWTKNTPVVILICTFETPDMPMGLEPGSLLEQNNIFTAIPTS